MLTGKDVRRFRNKFVARQVDANIGDATRIKFGFITSEFFISNSEKDSNFFLT